MLYEVITYLLNLDVNSAHYDPKSHSLRADPFEGYNVESNYHGDNVFLKSEDVNEMQHLQLFAWQDHEGLGAENVVQGDIFESAPTRIQELQQELQKRKEIQRTEKQKTLS